MNWNASEVTTNCKFRQKSLQEYSPISIGQYKFILHSQVITNYFQHCRGRQSIEIFTKSYATIVEIGSFCEIYLPQIDLTLVGPFEGVMESNSTHDHRTFHTLFLEEMQQRINTSQSRLGLEDLFSMSSESRIRPFNPNEYSLQFEFDNERLTAITTYLYKTQNELAQMIHYFWKMAGILQIWL